MMQLWHFSRSEIVMEHRYSCYSWLHTQIRSSSALRKEPWCSLQNGNDIANENKDHRMWVSNWLHLSCGINFSCQVYGRRGWCVRTYWDSRKWDFNLSVLPLVFSILGMWHKTASLKFVHSLHDRKAVTSELYLLPFFPSCIVTSRTIFRGNNAPMCLIAYAHSLKAWTTLWIVTICIIYTERVFASTIPPNAGSHTCFEGAFNQILMGKWLMT